MVSWCSLLSYAPFLWQRTVVALPLVSFAEFLAVIATGFVFVDVVLRDGSGCSGVGPDGDVQLIPQRNDGGTLRPFGEGERRDLDRHVRQRPVLHVDRACSRVVSSAIDASATPSPETSTLAGAVIAAIVPIRVPNARPASSTTRAGDRVDRRRPASAPRRS